MASSLFLSCQKRLDDQLFYEGDHLVLNAMLKANAPFRVELSRTFPATGLADSNYFVALAQVTLFENDSLLFSLVHQEKGIYVAPPGWRPQIGVTYHLEAEAAGFPAIRTQVVTVPPAPQIQNLQFQDSVFTPGSTDASGGVVRFELSQRMSEPDFYRFNALLSWNDSLAGPTALIAQETLTGNASCGNGGDFFTDVCLLTQPFLFQFNVTIQTERINGEFKRPDRLTIRTSQVSESAYRYYQNLQQPEDFEQAFTEPAPPYTNVESGYGFLGAEHVVELVIEL